MPSRARWLLLAVAWVLLAGCIEHRTAVSEPSCVAELHDPVTLLRISEHREPWHTPLAKSGGLPQEERVTAYARDVDGDLWRADVHLTTPLPWWQRFPADVFSDLLWPGTIVVESRATVQLHRVGRVSRDELDRLAHEAGYAGRATEDAR